MYKKTLFFSLFVFIKMCGSVKDFAILGSIASRDRSQRNARKEQFFDVLNKPRLNRLELSAVAKCLEEEPSLVIDNKDGVSSLCIAGSKKDAFFCSYLCSYLIRKQQSLRPEQIHLKLIPGLTLQQISLLTPVQVDSMSQDKKDALIRLLFKSFTNEKLDVLFKSDSAIGSLLTNKKEQRADAFCAAFLQRDMQAAIEIFSKDQELIYKKFRGRFYLVEQKRERSWLEIARYMKNDAFIKFIKDRIPQLDVTKMTPDYISFLSIEEICLLTPQQLEALNADQIKRLPTAAFYLFDQVQQLAVCVHEAFLTNDQKVVLRTLVDNDFERMRRKLDMLNFDRDSRPQEESNFEDVLEVDACFSWNHINDPE